MATGRLKRLLWERRRVRPELLLASAILSAGAGGVVWSILAILAAVHEGSSWEELRFVPGIFLVATVVALLTMWIIGFPVLVALQGLGIGSGISAFFAGMTTVLLFAYFTQGTFDSGGVVEPYEWVLSLGGGTYALLQWVCALWLGKTTLDLPRREE